MGNGCALWKLRIGLSVGQEGDCRCSDPPRNDDDKRRQARNEALNGQSSHVNEMRRRLGLFEEKG